MLPPNFIGQWQYDALRENSGVSATDLAHLNTAREPLLQALAMPFVYRALVLNAKKTVLDISANEQGQVVMQTNHFAGDFDSKFDNVVSEKFSPLTLGNAETQDITMLDGSTALARALMVESNLTLQIMLPHVAPYPLVHTYTLMDHNNALRLNVVFGDLNLNFYFLRVISDEI